MNNCKVASCDKTNLLCRVLLTFQAAFVLAFFCGVLVLQFLRDLPSLINVLIFLLIAVGFSLLATRKFRKFFLLISAFLLGFSWSLWRAQQILAWELPSADEGKKILVIGKIAALPVRSAHFNKFIFATTKIHNQAIKTRLLLSCYERNLVPHAGETWQLQVRLKRPHGMFNPGGFDFEQYLFEHHIRATGYVMAGMLLRKAIPYSWLTVREKMRDKINRSLFNNPFSGIINALVVGDQSSITLTQWQILRDTGTSYLVAIAGLHIGLAAAIVFFFVKFLWRRSERLTLFLPALYAATIAGLIVAVIYSAISGWSIPTERALTMFAVFSLALLLKRNLAPAWTLLLALFVVLVIDPLAVLSPGFWLSFGAVAAIAYAACERKKLWYQKYIYLQIVVLLGLLPFTLLFFQQVSMSAFFANILAMPGVCLVVVPLSLMGAFLAMFCPDFGGWLLWVAAKLMAIIWQYISFFAQWSWFNWYHPIFNPWILLTTIIGIVLILTPYKWWLRILGVGWLLPLFFYVPAKPQGGDVWFTLLDVGQGLSAIVQTKNHVLVYDTGPRFSTTDAGAAVIVPFLRAQGRTKVDMVVISHGDEDHIGGVQSLLQVFPAPVYTSVPEKFAQAFHCYSDQEWQWDGVKFRFLYPLAQTDFSGNNASCVLKISAGNNSVLLTGDIEAPAEEILLQNSDLKTSILVAPHHGSNTSSTAEFIAATQPDYVLFPVGYRNRFHFPQASVVRRYEGSGAHLFMVANTGAIMIKFNAASIFQISFWRERARYWNDGSF